MQTNLMKNNHENFSKETSSYFREIAVFAVVYFLASHTL